MKSVYIKCLSFSILILIIHNASSQQLKVGDTLPDIGLSNVIHYPKDSVKLSELVQKLIVIDFWSTNCTGCIEAFPHLDSLQRKFGGKMQIIAVNWQSKDWILSFLSKHRKIRLPSSVPFVTSDTVLFRYFPHSFSGMHVWLDSNLVVQQITNPWNLTEKNITDYLLGKPLNLLQASYVENSIITDPIVKELSKATDYYSIITHAVSGVSTRNGSERSLYGKVYRRWRGNVPPIQLYITAYGQDGKYNVEPKNTWILRGIDSAHFFYPAADSLWDDFMEHYCYNYQIRVPVRAAENLYQFMQQDLIRYFGIKGRISKRRIKCLILTRKDTNKKIKNQMGIAKIKFNKSMLDSAFIVKDSTMKGFIHYLRSIFIANNFELPLIDKTGYKGAIAMIIPNGIFSPSLDLEKFNEVLNEYGFNIILKRKKTDVIILKPKIKEGTLF